MNNQPLIKFNPKLPKLSKTQQKVLKLLVEAAELIAPIYLEQENSKYPGANFYPHDATKEEIKKTAKSNPEILSSYTIVERVNGKLRAIPYHIKYAELLKPIADKLTQASTITENKEFGRFLKLQAKALTEGSYKEAVIVGLKMKPYILDVSIGPVDYFNDQLFSAKASYLAWVGTLDIEGTNRLNDYKSITLSAKRRALMPKERIDPDKIEAKVLDIVLLSGLIARTKFVGINLPIDVNIVEKYGAEVILFNQPNALRLKEQILPTFNRMFSKGFKQGFSKEDLRRGYLRYVALHELAHNYLYYKNSAKNLQDLFPCIYELAATTLGFRMAGALLLKDKITNKQLESMIVTYLCRSMYLINTRNVDNSMLNYAIGGAIFVNFMLESGAIKQLAELSILNFTKIFVSLHDLTLILERILAQGTRKDAEIFIKQYSHSLFPTKNVSV